MRARYYPIELKNEAIRLVTEQRLSAAETASRLNVRAEAVLVWVKRFRDRRSRLSEINSLKAKLHEIASERDALIEITTRLLDRTG
jgi:transposase-like protein